MPGQKYFWTVDLGGGPTGRLGRALLETSGADCNGVVMQNGTHVLEGTPIPAKGHQVDIVGTPA